MADALVSMIALSLFASGFSSSNAVDSAARYAFDISTDIPLRASLFRVADNEHILVAAVQRGVGREVVHEVIKEHAVAVALAMREEGRVDNDLLDRLAADDRLPLDRAALDDLLADPAAFVGAAPRQVAAFARTVEEWTSRFPEAAGYTPGDIL